MTERRVRVAGVKDIPEGEGRVVEAGSETLAVFNVDGQFFAISNECAHRGGPLGEGPLDGHVVMCPWHAWRFDVRTGANLNNPAVKVGCLPVTVEDDGIYVDLGGC
jgi:nitrite reductase/ring-hydroxylating ferredoxin subunit